MLAEPIVRLLFERGAFTTASTDRASLALICLAPGLVAFSTVNILARAFFALGDTKTPMKISLACLTLNLLLAAALVVPLKQGGLGIANTVTSICNAGLLFFALRKNSAGWKWRRCARRFCHSGSPVCWPDSSRGRVGSCGKILSATKHCR